MTESTPSFGQWLRFQRSQLGLTQAALADELGCATVTLRKIETDALRPSVAIIRQLARRLDIEGAELAALIAWGRGGPRPAGIQADTPAPPAPPRGITPPAPPTALLGREELVSQISAQLADPTVRLLSLIGPAGVGKTRLAAQVARLAAQSFGGGVWFVDLAPIRDPALVPHTIARAILPAASVDADPLAALAEALGTAQALLVLDNLEHVIAAAPALGQLVQQTSALTVLLTSRLVPNLYGERLIEVGPLPPEPASQLFLQRAAAARPGFTVGPGEAALIAEICGQLDGLPLALELAAARLRLTSLEAIHGQLEQRLNILVAGPRDRSPRQQTMRGALDWSYDLLAADEQAMFGRLALFAGGWTPAAAAWMQPGDPPASPPGQTGAWPDAALALFDHGLARRRDGEDERMGMFEIVREYGLERLAAQGDRDPARRRFVAFYAELADQFTALFRQDERRCLDHLEREHANLRQAIAWAIELGRCDEAGRIVSGLWRFWDLRGYLREGCRWLTAVLECAGELSPAIAARVRLGAGWISFGLGAGTEAREQFSQSAAIARLAGDRHTEALALNGMGSIALVINDIEGARASFEASLAYWRSISDVRNVAMILNNLAIVATYGDRLDDARRLIEEGIELKRADNDHSGLLISYSNLIHLAFLQGDDAESRRWLEAADALSQRIGSPTHRAIIHYFNGLLAARAGDLGAAHGQLRQCVELAGEVGDHELQVQSLEACGHVLHLLGAVDAAIRLLAAAALLEQEHPVVRPPADQRMFESFIGPLRQEAGPERWEAGWRAGQGMSRAEVVALFARHAP